MKNERSEIVLIGPSFSGKSTTSRILASHLGIGCCSLDQKRWRYFSNAGYSREEEATIKKQKGVSGVLEYWQKFEVEAVRNIFSDYSNVIFDFGGGYTIQTDPNNSKTIADLLQKFKNVILLLHSEKVDQAVMLMQRRAHFDISSSFCREHIQNHMRTKSMASKVLFTENHTPSQIATLILEHIRS